MDGGALVFLEDEEARRMAGAWPSLRITREEPDVMERWAERAAVPLHRVRRLAPALWGNGICIDGGGLDEEARKFLRLSALASARRARGGGRAATT